ncbi:hypothetical protein QP028_11120 [Corynebacterium suedekumii]|nr:hypothetical protein QP028_11120 [Corynebacterium suedekumii]
MLNLTTDAFTPKQVEERTGFTLATLATWRSRGDRPEVPQDHGPRLLPQD